MRTALRMTKPIEIKTNGRAKVLVNGEEVALSDITAIRYAFGDEHGDCGFLYMNPQTGALEWNAAINVIAENRKNITKSLHLIELNVVELDMEAVVNTLRQTCGKVAIFLYLDFDGHTTQFERQLNLAAPAFNLVDRIMIREKTAETMTHADIKQLKEYVEAKLGVSRSDKIGFCDSPVGCSLGLSCLSARLCRELSAKYGDSIDMVVPSQNHEGMNNDSGRACNCIGFITAEKIEALPPVNVTGKSRSELTGTSSEAGQTRKPARSKKTVIRW